MHFRFQRLEIPEVVLVESQSFEDGRGFFSESYKLSVFRENGIPDEFVQDNHSRSVNGTLRGLHFQLAPKAQAKLVMAAHEVYLPKPKLAVEGPGGVQASFDFRGAKNDVAGQMLTVTLTNDLDGTVYA